MFNIPESEFVQDNDKLEKVWQVSVLTEKIINDLISRGKTKMRLSSTNNAPSFSDAELQPFMKEAGKELKKQQIQLKQQLKESQILVPEKSKSPTIISPSNASKNTEIKRKQANPNIQSAKYTPR
ncbi:MAG: hypothetical protein EZS28_049320 [Streblomastix strix]|uniref:Uncharacterized protein n=1 Tax=Streblomastix strix TaxID=222440 RepID=A0A5J4TBB7_9EUKA|nr:MAG: hypothetical protein EZS28_049320 [Streblomastix strix]